MVRAGLLPSLISLSLVSGNATAGSVAGTGGSTEFTQIMNNVELANSYAQQILDYEAQLMQYATMLKNLMSNPLGVLAPDLDKAIRDVARLWSVGKNIASSLSQIDKTFADTFNSPIALNFSKKFDTWHESSMDGLKSAMLNAGLQRENFESDTDALGELIKSVERADGALGALQALGSLNAAQINEAMKLRDLISLQQVAQNNYLAAKASTAKATEDRGKAIAGKLVPLPTASIVKEYTPIDSFQ